MKRKGIEVHGTPSLTGEILFYQIEDGRTRVECRFMDETLWLSQTLEAELYQKDVRTINEHLKNIYEDSELKPEATIRKFRIVESRVPGKSPGRSTTTAWRPEEG